MSIPHPTIAQALRLLLPLACVALLGACSETQFLMHTAKRITTTTDGTASDITLYKVGKPYQIGGVWYYPQADYDYEETGIASWYGPGFHGKATANGESYDMNGLSAAHRTLPLPSFVRVTNLENGRSLVLRVNDRGPFAHGRILDASRRAAQLLGFENKGTARVKVQIMAAESRAVAARLQGQSTLASIGTPITAEAMPKANVSQTSIEPPSGGESTSPVDQNQNDAAVPSSPLADRRDVAAPTTGVVTTIPVGPTSVYVQAGAYSYFDNANRVRARLSGLGNVNLSSVLVGGKDLFRVRVGPVAVVSDADRILEQVIQSGYPDARIVVE